jgi:DNA-binding NtrC family response regulator
VRILVVEDDDALSEVLQDELKVRGHEVFPAASVKEAKEALAQRDYDVILLDLVLPDGRGTEVLQQATEDNLPLEAVVLTGYAELTTAIAAMKLGAYDYLSKPIRMDELEQVVLKAADKARLRRENEALRDRVDRMEIPTGIVTDDPAMKSLLRDLDKVARTDLPILVTGESGTGKELVARAVHKRSGRAAHACVTFNCAAVPETLLESELFGYERGAFTGALGRKLGLFELAERGTLFLDEIGEVSPALQVKLLRAVETGEVYRLGSTRPLKLDVRIVTATNRDLRKEVRDGRFREDLYFRLNGATLKLPALRDRPKDIALLARHFLDQQPGRKMSLGRSAIDKLESYTWPGNVRELQMVVRRAAALAKAEVVEAGDLPIDLVSAGRKAAFKTGLTLAELEREYIKTVLEENKGHRGKTARALGIDAKTLYNKLASDKGAARRPGRRDG